MPTLSLPALAAILIVALLVLVGAIILRRRERDVSSRRTPLPPEYVSLDDLGATEVTRQVRRITPPLDMLDDGEAVDPNPLPASWGGPDDVDDLDDDGPEAA